MPLTPAYITCLVEAPATRRSCEVEHCYQQRQPCRAANRHMCWPYPATESKHVAHYLLQATDHIFLDSREFSFFLSGRGTGRGDRVLPRPFVDTVFAATYMVHGRSDDRHPSADRSCLKENVSHMTHGSYISCTLKGDSVV